MFQTLRPTRQAAQVAALRIAEWAQRDNTSTDSESDTPTTDSPTTNYPLENGIDRARRYGYDETAFVARYLVSQCNKADYEDQRIEIAEKLFDILNSNPSILIHEPKFRNIVQGKIKEFEEYIDTRNKAFKKAQYREAIDIMKLSMRVNIRNSKMRESIFKHLADINIILNSYDSWSRCHDFKLQLKKMNNILESIKTHPDYVLA